MRKHSNQRITKIKIDAIEELLKQAEGIAPEDGTTIRPLGSDLTPYPDLNKYRVWVRDYILKGTSKLFIRNRTKDTADYDYTTIVDGLILKTKFNKHYKKSDGTIGRYTKPGLYLSNLISPRYGNSCGNWLAQNMSFDGGIPSFVWERVSGNYAFTFMSNGNFKSQKGSLHRGQDSRNQMWCPQPDSCMDYESLILVGPTIRQSATTFMSLLAPTSNGPKNIQYNTGAPYVFIDGENLSSITTTTYNAYLPTPSGQTTYSPRIYDSPYTTDSKLLEFAYDYEDIDVELFQSLHVE